MGKDAFSFFRVDKDKFLRQELYSSFFFILLILEDCMLMLCYKGAAYIQSWQRWWWLVLILHIVVITLWKLSVIPDLWVDLRYSVNRHYEDFCRDTALLFLRVKERADCIVLEENCILQSALLYIIETFFSHLFEFVSSGFSICLNTRVSIYFFVLVSGNFKNDSLVHS